MQNAISCLNKETSQTFIPGRDFSSKDGGVPGKSKYNPVRQYNSIKPEQYRIDFFILATTSGGHNFIYHINVYQSNNKNYISIPPVFWNLPTTQKAVVNIRSTGF